MLIFAKTCKELLQYLFKCIAHKNKLKELCTTIAFSERFIGQMVGKLVFEHFVENHT